MSSSSYLIFIMIRFLFLLLFQFLLLKQPIFVLVTFISFFLHIDFTFNL